MTVISNIATAPEIAPNRPSTVVEFEQWLIDNKTYTSTKRFEFLNGRIIEKLGMKQNEFFITDFLTRLFGKTAYYQNGDALMPESDSYINEKRKRIADLAYFTKDQIQQARKGERFAASFAIEILSPNELLVDIEEKIQDYFEANAQIVWYISPNQQQIYVYTSPTTVTILRGKAVCSAAPVLPDFSFKVEELFVG